MTPFEQLQENVPVFELRNKTSVPQIISLKGDSVQVQPNAKVTIPSPLFRNLPDSSIFKIMRPTIEERTKVGLIKDNTPVKSNTTNPEVKKDDVSSSDKSSLSNKSNK